MSLLLPHYAPPNTKFLTLPNSRVLLYADHTIRRSQHLLGVTRRQYEQRQSLQRHRHKLGWSVHNWHRPFQPDREQQWHHGSLYRAPRDSDAYAYAYSDAYAYAYSDAHTYANAHPDSDAHSDTNSDANAHPDSDTNSDSDSDANPDSYSNAHSDTNSDTDSDTDANAYADAHTYANAHPDSDTNSDANPDTDSDTDANAYANAYAHTNWWRDNAWFAAKLDQRSGLWQSAHYCAAAGADDLYDV